MKVIKIMEKRLEINDITLVVINNFIVKTFYKLTHLNGKIYFYRTTPVSLKYLLVSRTYLNFQSHKNLL